MYYEEEIREGVLCYRADPKGLWVRPTHKKLTELYLAVKMEHEQNVASQQAAEVDAEEPCDFCAYCGENII